MDNGFLVVLHTVFVLGSIGQEIDTAVELKAPKIVSMYIRSNVVYRYASTRVTSTVVNDDFLPRETAFDVSLPEDAFISNFTLEIDGIEYVGVVKEKEEAKRQYDRAKKRGQTAGHIGTRPRDTNRFRVNINVAAQSEVSFILTYDELLRRRKGVYEHTIYINPRQIVDQLVVEVFIFESRDITILKVPPLRNDILNEIDASARNEFAVIRRPSPRSANIRYSPSPEQQMRSSEEGVNGLFVVEYDVTRSLDAGDIYLVNGYFVHFFAPTGIDPLRKRILFILDTSGSMSWGGKMEQLKDAMRNILDDLNEEDLFNIVVFDSSVSSWSNYMKKATKRNKELAKDMVDNLEALGGTDINAALMKGLDILQNTNEIDAVLTAPLIVFLTDGEPTYGETNTRQILKNVEQKNRQRIQIFSLAFGDDADYEFIKYISTRSTSFARKIYADSDAALQLTGFYAEISTVLLSNVSFSYLKNSVNESTLTRSSFPSFFDGSELVVSGRVHDNSIHDITLNIAGRSQGGIIELSSSNSIVDIDFNEINDDEISIDFETIIERMWAYLTIKQRLDERLKTENKIVKNFLKEEAIRLAIKYNFVTPVTSMVVTKPETKGNASNFDIQEDDGYAVEKEASGAPMTVYSSSIYKGPQGLKGSTGTKSVRSAPGYADSDPHFIVNVKGLEHAVCFDVMGRPGDVYQLIKDKYSGLLVNARIVANKPDITNTSNSSNETVPDQDDEDLKTFLGEIIIRRHSLHAVISAQKIRINGDTIPWQKGTSIDEGKAKFVIDKENTMLAVMFKDRIAVLIMRHLRSRELLRKGKVNYLGFYIVEDKGLSYHTHGLLGQFLHRNITLKKQKTRNGKTLGRLRVTGNIAKARKVMASLGHRINLATNNTVTCWMVQHAENGLIDGKIEDYLLSRKQDT
ncbi:hypothetical protein CHS0354_030981 [Potamilus streckersoni]|uniref:Inter-alpha-trypsin inhibitor heavy chain H3-like n=1 Tax=Potamilus streckersoni TaxID=2493646 RepID=A0AAE0SF42_9BIVA|nr:hypothetical protein CHS0354_030981 [Potamilus streckersoni]